MNQYEIVFLILAELLLLAYLRWKSGAWTKALILAAASVIPLYMSLLKVSQFLTVDETHIIVEPLYLSQGTQWGQGALRTTEVLLSPIIRVLMFREFAIAGDVPGKMVLKNLHWLTGFGAVLWLHHLLDRYVLPVSNRKLYFVVFIYTAFLLPTNLQAFKVFNYDLLSMLLGIIAGVYVLLAIKNRHTGHALLGVILALLATQEKASATPVLFLAIAMYAYVRCEAMSRCTYGRLLGNLLLGYGIALAVSAASLFAIIGVQLTKYPAQEILAAAPYRLPGIADPFILWAAAISISTAGVLSQSTGVMTNLRIQMPLLLAISVLIGYLLSIVLLHAVPYFTKRASSLNRVVRSASNLLVIIAFLVGVLGACFVHVYWAPLYPIEPGNYHPVGAFNGMTWHFGVTSFGQHLASFIAYAYSGFVQAIPTAYWLSFAALLVITLVQHRVQEIDLGLEVLFMLALLMPLGFGILQMPASAKYVNIALLLFACILMLKVVEGFGGFSQAVQVSYVVVFVMLLLLELLPFRPLFFAFRPIWENYDEAFDKTPIVGQIDTAWIGWGEEMMLAGETLERRCLSSGDNTLDGVPCNSIRLYAAYTGDWLAEEREINTIAFWTISSPDQYSYTAADYYVINRSTIVQRLREFPADVEPDFVISYRGYTQAWVFRGDHLKQAGYEF